MHRTPEKLHKSPQSHPRILSAGAYSAHQGRDYPSHEHHCWELTYYRTGAIRCLVGDEVYESQPGMLLLTPPHTMHAELALTDYANYYIAVAAPADQPWPRMCLDDHMETLNYLCAAIVREWLAGIQTQQEMLYLLGGQLDIVLQRLKEQQQLSEVECLVRRAEYIFSERFTMPITIQEVARELGVSPSYLRAQFVRLRGQSPAATLQEIRLRNALSMLRNSSSSITTIATMCGYDSASHLSRYVKRATGKSPGLLRTSST